MNADMKDQIAELLRGTSEVLVEAELVKKLSRGKPLRPICISGTRCSSTRCASSRHLVTR